MNSETNKQTLKQKIKMANRNDYPAVGVSVPDYYFDDEQRCNICWADLREHETLVPAYKIFGGKKPKDGKGSGRMYYQCSSCESYVGASKKAQYPLGVFADEEMRALKLEIKRQIRLLTKDKSTPLYNNEERVMYHLSNHLGLAPFECHIGWFDTHLLNKTLKIMQRKDWWKYEHQELSESLHLVVTSNDNVPYSVMKDIIVQEIGYYFLGGRNYDLKEVEPFISRTLISTDVDDVEVYDVCKELNLSIINI